MTASHKRAHGQFFTQGNPFVFTPFRQWFTAIPGIAAQTLLEPFAGANHLVRLMREAGYHQAWACFDIDPPHCMAHGVAVQRRNTLRHFPRGFEVVVTNPPYLARNSAVRRGLPYPDTAYDDLYKHALAITLARVPYVAAIIPESFLGAGIFHDRLHSVVSLTSPMFTDTDCPVCLALFVPANGTVDGTPGAHDFALWDEDTYLGQYQRFAHVLAPVAEGTGVAWKFNDPTGSLGLLGVDHTQGASIRFVEGATIPSQDIKPTSRAITRISGVPAHIDLTELIACANQALADYRAATHDTLMTAFKGLRVDGKYRRRLDFAAARHLLDHSVQAIVRGRGPVPR